MRYSNGKPDNKADLAVLDDWRQCARQQQQTRLEELLDQVRTELIFEEEIASVRRDTEVSGNGVSKATTTVNLSPQWAT